MFKYDKILNYSDVINFKKTNLSIGVLNSLI